MTPMVLAAEEIEARLRAVATPERAAQEKRYLKSDLDFLGATMGQIRAAVKDVARERRELTHDELVMLVLALWAKPIHERRMASVLLLARFDGLLDRGSLPLVEQLIRESRTWSLVDALATDVVGSLVARDPDAVTGELDRWATDPDLWVRRSSLLAELRPIRDGAPLKRFLARAEPMLDEREFFVRKAIGWVLREAGRRRPDEVARWLAARTHRASGVTMREAVKHLPQEESARLMAAYREGRAAG
jgi:3-methyladenine DNA glycosylase AlkD